MNTFDKIATVTFCGGIAYCIYKKQAKATRANDEDHSIISSGRSSTRYPSTFDQDLFLIGNIDDQTDDVMDFEDCDRIYRMVNKQA